MMPSRDVILDLLPLYVSGEASPDSTRLVERAIAEDPSLAAAADALRRADPGAVPDPARSRDADRIALQRIRVAVRERSVLLALAIFLSLVPFSFFYAQGQMKLLLLRDAPAVALASLAAGAGCWLGWFLLGRRIGRMA